MIELNDEQRQAVSEYPDEPLRLMDATTQQAYVLVQAEVYDRLKGLLYEDGEYPTSESYPLVDEVLAKEGWDDPIMDVYDDFAAKEGQ